MASAGLHLLLAVILLFGSAFMSRNSALTNVSDLNFEPTILTDSDLQGGGNPNAGRPPSQHRTSAPAPKPPPAIKEETVKEESKPERKPREAERERVKEKIEAESFETSSHKSKPRIQISTNLVTHRTSNRDQIAKANAAKAAAEARRAAQAQRELASAFADAASDLSSSGSSVTHLVIGDNGPGGGGPSYGGYASWVRKVYMDAWAPPSDPSKENAVAEAVITILRDGTIDDFRIIKHSGDLSVDASVQKTLERVRSIGRPFPEGAKDGKRTYTLVFDLKAKRGLA